jgi:hypothetical protein
VRQACRLRLKKGRPAGAVVQSWCTLRSKGKIDLSVRQPKGSIQRSNRFRCYYTGVVSVLTWTYKGSLLTALLMAHTLNCTSVSSAVALLLNLQQKDAAIKHPPITELYGFWHRRASAGADAHSAPWLRMSPQKLRTHIAY